MGFENVANVLSQEVVYIHKSLAIIVGAEACPIPNKCKESFSRRYDREKTKL